MQMDSVNSDLFSFSLAVALGIVVLLVFSMGSVAAASSSSLEFSVSAGDQIQANNYLFKVNEVSDETNNTYVNVSGRLYDPSDNSFSDVGAVEVGEDSSGLIGPLEVEVTEIDGDSATILFKIVEAGFDLWDNYPLKVDSFINPPSYISLTEFSVSKSNVDLGEEFSVDVVLTNGGTQAVKNVSLDLDVPGNFTLLNKTSSSSFDLEGTSRETVSFELRSPTDLSSLSEEFTFEVDKPIYFEDKVGSRRLVDGESQIPGINYNYDSVNVTVEKRVPDLSLDVEDRSVKRGEVAEFTIEVINSEEATGLAKDISFEAVTNGSVDVSFSKDSLSELEPGETEGLVADVAVTDFGDKAGNFSLPFSFVAEYSNSYGDSDTIEANATLEVKGDSVLDVDVSVPSVREEEEGEVGIVVSNEGEGTIDSIEVSVDPGDGLRIDGSDFLPFGYIDSGGVKNQSIDVEAVENGTYSLTLEVRSPQTGLTEHVFEYEVEEKTTLLGSLSNIFSFSGSGLKGVVTNPYVIVPLAVGLVLVGWVAWRRHQFNYK
ncbi:MAG: S-layer protein, could be associated with type IV pili like system [Candidatus Methanohalarchaeum thermophilum]|uniref:S-layer protein, could be associated with type IV pili like system n=1 Tax=Methanohalarchaeum thermophilum TaxID=1903181 RepID=A0A1Q6DSN0_METT1|nr:MAG: S-layer protein, could be associated with type IV pili like system [Candidatus Methanohalarchaeum thermophilum]